MSIPAPSSGKTTQLAAMLPITGQLTIAGGAPRVSLAALFGSR
jgi:hypothetical protein